MKKSIFVFAALTAIFFTSCGEKSNTTEAPKAPAVEAPETPEVPKVEVPATPEAPKVEVPAAK